jgi:pimeloyl-ACP methyl ester carboxylesterase
MGGQVAIITALQHPQKVSKLILVAPAGLEAFTESEGKMMLTVTTPSFFAKQDEAVIRAAFKQNFHQLPADAETLVLDRLRFRTCADFALYTEAVAAGVKGMLQRHVKNELSNLKKPVLLLFGTDDALIPNKIFHPSLQRDEMLKEAEALLPKAKIISIPAAGHLLQYEKPAEVTDAIRQFLK